MRHIAWLRGTRVGTTVARPERMTIEIALFLVALVTVLFAAWRVMARERAIAVQDEAPPEPPRRRPRHFALPPVTIETTPIKFKYMPEMVPPIDHRVLAALFASGSRTAAEVPPPERLARGSIPPSGGHASNLAAAASDLDAETLTSHSDLDGAETLRPASDLDEDALTRTNMSPVR